MIWALMLLLFGGGCNDFKHFDSDFVDESAVPPCIDKINNILGVE